MDRWRKNGWPPWPSGRNQATSEVDGRGGVAAALRALALDVVGAEDTVEDDHVERTLLVSLDHTGHRAREPRSSERKATGLQNR